jgi:hypothetical protein
MIIPNILWKIQVMFQTTNQSQSWLRKGMLQTSAQGIVEWTVVCDPIPLSQQNTESTPIKKSMGGC